MAEAVECFGTWCDNSMKLLLLALLLSACTHNPSILRGSGTPADAPYGYTVGCQNNPDAVACKETAK